MFYISYFYQIRFFNKDLLPISTAMWDPKWFHRKGATIYRDDNGVVNGIKCPWLTPYKVYNKSLDCSKDCTKEPATCDFLKNYYNYLCTLDFKLAYKALNDKVKQLGAKHGVLIVHETPSNLCSERIVLVKWFENNGVPLPEWDKKFDLY